MLIRTRNPYFRLVGDLFNDTRPWLTKGGQFEAGGFSPALDVEENADAYIVRANLPGISQDDISVNMHEDVLTISAESAAENRDEASRMLIRERRFGKFSRSLRFPTAVSGDAVEAAYEDGVLRISLPKADSAKPLQIPVKVGAESS